MKVLHLLPHDENSTHFAPYTFLREELQGLANLGVEVNVLSLAASEDHTEGGIKVRAAPRERSITERQRTLRFLVKQLNNTPGLNLLDARRLYYFSRVERAVADIVKRVEVDIIHSHFGWPGGFGGLMAQRATGQPLIASFRGFDLNTNSTINYGARLDPSYDRAIRHLLKKANYTLYNSEFMRNQALRLGASPATARVITKGVDLAHFSPLLDKSQARRELGLGSSPVILTVAGLTPLKGIHDILAALGQLKVEHDFVFVVCGDGAELNNLKDLSRQLSIEENTKFVGRIGRERMPTYFAACDMFVLASIIDAAPNVVLEALSSGRPVVCTDSGGPAEYVTDEVTGYVVPVAAPTALAEKIKILLEKPSLREEMGHKARSYAESHLSHERMCRDVINIYNQVS